MVFTAVYASWPPLTGSAMWRILSSSSLPRAPAESAFRRYLTRDYLFLIHFARSYALLVSKMRTLPEMRAAAASMNAILNELPLRRLLCPVGISEPEMAAQPEAPKPSTIPAMCWILATRVTRWICWSP